MLAFSTMLAASLVEQRAWYPWLVIVVGLAFGVLFGLAMTARSCPRAS